MVLGNKSIKKARLREHMTGKKGYHEDAAEFYKQKDKLIKNESDK